MVATHAHTPARTLTAALQQEPTDAPTQEEAVVPTADTTHPRAQAHAQAHKTQNCTHTLQVP